MSAVPAPRTAGAAPVVRVRGLTKAYAGVTVLRDVDLQVAPGEVHALLGENGAGKSTLIKILSGVVRADAGTVEVDGRPVDITTPRSATDQGIATLHQELAIVPGLSVAENVLLGQRPPQAGGRVRWRELERRARELLAEVGQSLDVRQDAGRLTPVGRTMTAIARALAHDARLLVLDEPTAALTDQESAALLAAVRRLAARGVGVLWVSHRLEEVFDLCDGYSVLRNGELVAEGTVAGTTIPKVIAAMAGRSLDAVFPPRAAGVGRPLLTAEGLTGRRVQAVDLELREGEVLGVAGLAGSGRSELLRLLAGAQPRTAGSVRLTARDGHLQPAPRGLRAHQRAGVVLVPQERRADALLPDSVEHNTNVTTLGRHTRGRLLVHRGAARRHAAAAVASLDVRHRSLDQPVLQLSGGNQQKVVLARFLALDPRVLVLDEPTRGVDVATKSEIYGIVRRRTATGGAAVVASSELLELIGLCDRVLVLHEGRSTGVADAAATTEHTLLEAAYGRSVL